MTADDVSISNGLVLAGLGQLSGSGVVDQTSIETLTIEIFIQ